MRAHAITAFVGFEKGVYRVGVKDKTLQDRGKSWSYCKIDIYQPRNL